MFIYATFTLAVLGFWVALLAWRLLLARRNIRLPYPPGPPIKGLLSGNASDLASIQFPWVTYTNWGTEYGSLLHLRSFNQHFVIVNSIEDATELFEKRARNYSSRPFIPMWELMGLTYSTALRDNSPAWQKHRHVFQQGLRYDAAIAYRPIQTEKIKDMLHSILTTPDNFLAHIQTASSAIIMSAIYGYDVVSKDDRFIALVEGPIDGFEKGSSMAWKVNLLPILRHIPAWLPGAGFKRYCESVAKIVVDQISIPFKYTQDMLASGSARFSFVSSLIDNCQSESDLRILQEVSGTAYGAAFSTTTYTIVVFIVAMIMHPKIQAKAQRIIDSQTGGDRLVEYSDRLSIPYLDAIYREVLRWRPILPLSIPHSNRDDDVYKEYHIPKGAIMLGNIWAMTRDSSKYADPDTFNPGRFLDAKGELINDNVDFVFGFGRRICPGRHLASASVWLAMTTILQIFNLHPRKIASGSHENHPFDVKYTDGVLSHPLPFECTITPRSDKAEQLIREGCEKC